MAVAAGGVEWRVAVLDGGDMAENLFVSENGCGRLSNTKIHTLENTVGKVLCIKILLF